MNPDSANPFWKQQKMRKYHRDKIIYALRVLKKATSGPITEFVNKEVRAEVEKEYEVRHLFGDRQLIDKKKAAELKEKQISQRGVQYILPELEAEGIVFKNNDEYSLSKEGQAVKIFAEPYGKTLFARLVEIPLKGTKEEKILECIKRFGLYIAYIFLRNSSPTVVNSFYEAIEENDTEWVNDSIDIKSMFEWFTNEVYSKTEKDRYQNFFTLMKTLERQFPEYLPTLLKSQQDYYKNVFPDYYRKVILKKIKKERRE